MISTIYSQEKNKNKSPCSADSVLAEFPPKQKLVTEFILRHSVNGVLRISYATIMEYTKVGRSTVRVTINKLRDLGLLKWDAIYYETNIFYLSEELLNPIIRGFLMSSVKNIILFALLFSKPATAGDQPLYKNKEFITRDISNSYIVNREGQMAYVTNFYEKGFENQQALKDAGGFESEKREREIQAKQRRKYLEHEKLREQAIDNINKALPLTRHGRAKLFSYPAAALRFVFFKVENCYNKQDPFIYLISILERYCRENSYHIERSRYKKMCKELEINKTDDFIDDEMVALIVADRPNHPPHMAERYISHALKKEHDMQLRPESHLPFPADERYEKAVASRQQEFSTFVEQVRALPEEQKSWFHLFVIDLDDKDKEFKNN